MHTLALRSRFAAALCWAVASLLISFGTAAQELNSRVERAVSSARLGNGKVGVSILDTGSGRRLASLNADTAMIPASNQKLISSGVALSVLGSDFVFKTELILSGQTLIVKGAGDPGLGDPKLLGQVAGDSITVDKLVAMLASAVQNAGVSSLEEIVIDDTIFDREFVHASWPVSQLNRWYCAEVAGLNFHTNVLSVYVRPTKLGDAPLVRLQPHSPWMELQNNARTVATGENTTWIARPNTANRFTLYGDVRHPSQAPVDVTVHNVPIFFGRLLAQSLLDAGVRVGGIVNASDASRAPVRTRAVDEPAPVGARTIAVVTTQISDVLTRCNADSQNLYAEALLKRAGHHVTGDPGSWSNGAAVARMVMSERVGPDAAAGTVIADGSGMSRLNRVSADTMVRWLQAISQQSEIRETFLQSLATAGTGTLSRRFREYRPANALYAKSGAIDGVRCLSGYLVHGQTGRTVAFAVLCNDLTTGEASTNALKLHEQIVRIADEWLTTQANADASVFGG
ncbi:MAG: D-alanyl-D-alanine carboxypeptidase/D-alanyl-D-alanine-endopeptidase [Phycisphaeraceae bacterium]|nr:D-alanyl-D-alanine carboxypeptidase/D-alanyl-D-alanine-endopeptidase [Phycisphaeraceae bacterium]MBX3368290.1 D-alanyl-D-alanine carboxypeptidase/D-alanyl-D-alanine-endopeptidase [Phycisphaeraceae bacterium]QYK48925.1 MAG: D-alanyl-D-alanine carboxypeptidase/D-alanyl-D-alanine-endopeptidase [Phycisphaeraceae bacterium]